MTITGNGKEAIVFAHGFGCSQHTWQDIAPAFQQNYRTVLFDYVGSGGSDLSAYRPEQYSTLHGYAQDLLDVCDALQLKQCTLVGHSVSAMIAMLAAIKQPSRFCKLVLVSPNPYFFNEGEYTGGLNKADVDGLFTLMENNYLGWSSLMAPLIMGNADRPELGENLTASFCATHPDIARQFAKATFYADMRAYLPQLTTNSVTLQCANDMLAPVAVGKYIQQHTPNNSLIHLKATGHCPHLSAPQETVSAIKFYLENPACCN